MAFQSTTVTQVLTYLGYPFNDGEVDYVQAALDRIEALTNSTVANAAVTQIETWLAELQTIATAINTERGTEGSTLLTTLRYEGRRHVALVSTALQLEVRTDFFSSSAEAT